MKNSYSVKKNLVYINLNGNRITIIQKEDLPIASSIPGTWCGSKKSNGKFYVQCNLCGKTIYLHSLIVGNIPKGMVVDHYDTDTLNNKRDNLKVVSRKHNSQNRTGATKGNKTGIRGLSYNAGKDVYVARITVDGKLLIVGYYKDESEFHLAEKDLDIAREKYMPYLNKKKPTI